MIHSECIWCIGSLRYGNSVVKGRIHGGCVRGVWGRVAAGGGAWQAAGVPRFDPSDESLSSGERAHARESSRVRWC